MPLPLAVLGIIATGIIKAIVDVLTSATPVADGTLPPTPVTPPTPTKPPVSPPKNKPTTPTLPPPPSKPYVYKPDPKGKPFPTPPKRKLPKEVDLKQKEHKVTSSVSQTLATRVYGCLMYEPVTINTYTYCEYAPSNYWDGISDSQDNAFKSFVGWVLKESDLALDSLEQYPLLKILLDFLGLGEGSAEFLKNKLCELALAGVSIYVKGANNNTVVRNVFLYGCEAITDLALHYLERNQAVINSYPLILDTYINFELRSCTGSPDKAEPNALPDELTFNDATEWEPTTVLMPDPSAFTAKGNILVLFWVLESDPTYKTYYTTTQVNNPISALVDVLDSEGKVKDSCKANWDKYFKPLQRTQGYQHSRTYCNELKSPFADGFFDSKEDALQYFDKLYELTNYTVRDKAPTIHSSAEKDEYLKELSHVGQKLILKKVNVVKKDAWKDSAEVLISYKANSAITPK